MRKRIVIGVLAVVAIGVTVFFVSQPRKGSVEYHRKGYFAARNGGFLDHVAETWNGIVGRPTDFLERGARMESHETALIKLGYLEERTFVVSNRPASTIAVEIAMLSHGAIPKDRPWNVFHTSTNELAIIGAREDMPMWEKLVRKADAAPGGE